MDLVDLKFPKTNNPSGTKLVLYIAPVDSFDSIGAVPTAPATLAEANVIATDHTFAAASGKGFVKVELEVNKNDLQAAMMGAVSGGARKHTFTGFHTNASDEALAFFEIAAREKQIILVPLSDGKLIQLGEENNGAMIKADFGIGTQDGGERGFPITAEYYGYTSRYNGTVTFASANI